MYAINKGMKRINGVKVDTFSRDVDVFNVSVKVEAGTTGFSRFARGYVGISVKEGDIFARVKKDEEGTIRGIEIAVGGCAPLLALLESMEFATRALMETCGENTDIDD